jgi:hypothetical protein
MKAMTAALDAGDAAAITQRQLSASERRRTRMKVKTNVKAGIIVVC